MRIELLQPEKIQPWEVGEMERIAACLKSVGDVEITSISPERIILLESNLFKTQRYIPELLAHPAVAVIPWKLVAINYEDSPAGFLPGAYSSLERQKFDTQMHLSWPHLRPPNEAVLKTELMPVPSNAYLFSFAGSCSHPVRRTLFKAYPTVTETYKVVEIKKWYNHNDSEKSSYIEDIVGSHFVLCPRGIASYSHRILEVLALGRVPVIIADDWVPFSIPEENYYVRVAQKDLEHLPEILSALLPRYEAMAASVRAVYGRYFAPAVCYHVLAEKLLALPLSAQYSRDYFKKRWSRRDFWWANGWCLEQRVVRLIKRIIKRLFKIK